MPDSPTTELESDFVCDCEDWMRSACDGEPFYREHEGNRYCVFHFPGNKSQFWEALRRKLKANKLDFSGVWFPGPCQFKHVKFTTHARFGRTRFEGEVDFTGATFEETADFSRATFAGGAYFSEVTFKSVDFSSASFFGSAQFSFTTFAAIASFRGCKFNAVGGFHQAIFEKDANFRGATFSMEAPFDSADFTEATFRGRVDFDVVTFVSAARFNGAVFEGLVDLSNSVFGGLADFRFTTFVGVTLMHSFFNSNANFTSAAFKDLASFYGCSFTAELDFSAARFRAAAHFGNATFGGYVKFNGDPAEPMFNRESFLDFQFAKIDQPNHVSFHSVLLRPCWFVNVNPREFEFLDVRWRLNFKDEIKFLTQRKVSSPYTRLSKIFRDLALNCEENHNYYAGSRFRYWAMDTLRREYWLGIPFWRLAWWYWLASGYGEQVFKAFSVLLGIWFVAGLLYTRVGFARWEPKLTSEPDVVAAKRDEIGAPLKFSRALTYSAGVMTLQKPEPRPATTAAQTVVFLETILGPVQAALLALAIRRKFMR
jgi:uncharacterized protein YjbI with pentapeptide repeats